MPIKRKRDSFKLSKEGMEAVEHARLKKGWGRTDYRWCDRASLALPTLKRFIRGDKISRDCFISLCEAIGLEDWMKVADLTDIDSQRVTSSEIQDNPHEATSRSTQPSTNRISFMVTAIYTEETKFEMEAALTHLRKLLSTCSVTIEPSKHSLAVTGTFTEEARAEVEIVLEHMEKLLPACNTTLIPTTHS